MNPTRKVARLLLPVLATATLVGGVASGPASATNPPDDGPFIPGLEQDFGASGGLIPYTGTPAGPGLLVWDTSAQTIRPTLTGSMYVDDSFGLHVRMEMKYYDVFGNWLATKRSPDVYAGSSGVVEFPINISSYANPDIYMVEISTTYKLGPKWYRRDTQAMYI